MLVGVLTVRLYAPWVHSLKEKRMELKSLTTKLRGKFNISVAEVAEQDTHQTMVIGIAAVAANTGLADSVMDNVLRYIEGNTQAEVVSVERDIL